MAEFRWIVLGNKRFQQEYIVFLEKSWRTVNNPAYLNLSNHYMEDKDYVKFFNDLMEVQRLNYMSRNYTTIISCWRVFMMDVIIPLIKFSDRQVTSLYNATKFSSFCDVFPFPLGVEELSFSEIFPLFKDYRQKTVIFESKLIQV